MLTPGGVFVSSRRSARSGNCLRSAIDEPIDLGHRVTVVQPALETVAEQRAEALAVADAFEDLARDAHARRRQVDGEAVRIRRARVREIAAAQHRRRHRMVKRRREHVAAVRRVAHER